MTTENSKTTKQDLVTEITADVLSEIKSHKKGLTLDDLSTRLRYDSMQISKVLHELRDKGAIEQKLVDKYSNTPLTEMQMKYYYKETQ